jgi:chemotaxis signal transduction protein
MTHGRDRSAWTAADLRRDFDQVFAQPPCASRDAPDDFIAIGLCGEPHALRVIDVSGVLPLNKLGRFPSPVAELCGVIGLRGALMPVYDLRMLLGYVPRQAALWLAVAAAAPVALAFDTLDGHLRAGRDARAQQPGAEDGRRHVREVLRDGPGLRPIVSIASVLDAIQARLN